MVLSRYYVVCGFSDNLHQMNHITTIWKHLLKYLYFLHMTGWQFRLIISLTSTLRLTWIPFKWLNKTLRYPAQVVRDVKRYLLRLTYQSVFTDKPNTFFLIYNCHTYIGESIWVSSSRHRKLIVLSYFDIFRCRLLIWTFYLFTQTIHTLIYIYNLITVQYV